MAHTWEIGGASALSEHAPMVQVVLGGVVAAWPESLTEVRFSTIRTVAAEALGLKPLRTPPTGPRRRIVLPENAVMAFAEQFAADVQQIPEELLTDYRTALGADVLSATQAVFVADVVPRARAVLDAVFGHDVWVDPPLTPTTRIGEAVDELMREVSLLDVLDPVTTELVRLRAARQIGCRVSMSMRSVAARHAGADDALLEAVDRFRGSVLTPAQQAALGLVDALVWTPANVRAVDRAAVRAHLSPAQAVEVVLDVVRMLTGKVLVALGLDAPRVQGVQLFRLTGRGDVVFL